MKRFCKDLKEHATKIINYEKIEMIPLTDEENKFYKKRKLCYICKKVFSTDDDNKKYHKVRDYCHYAGKYREAAHSVCKLSYKTPNEIPILFLNSFTYGYCLVIKELAKEFEGHFECLGENIEKYIIFSVPIKKELDNGKTITYKLKFIDSFRFMSTSLSSLVDNLSEKLYSDKCKDCKSELDYMSIKNNQLIFQCLKCKKNYKKDYKELIKRFANTYEFCNGDTNKFILLLRKGVYPYEYMDSWERFNETSLPEKKAFYSELNLEDVTDKDYVPAQKLFKELKLKNLGDYHDLYVQSDTLLLADVFGNFRNKCIEIYELDLAHFLSAPGLAQQACLKKTGIKLELLTNNDMLMMVEKGLRGRICRTIHRYSKANNKYMKNFNKNIELSYLMYLDANDLYGSAMFQKLAVNGFKWKRNVSKFNKEFIKSYDEDSNKGY